jgi:hypothetical protein
MVPARCAGWRCGWQRNGTNHVNGCKLTHDGHVDGNAKMPMVKPSAKSQDLRGECLMRMVYDARPVGDLSRPYDMLT